MGVACGRQGVAYPVAILLEEGRERGKARRVEDMTQCP